MFQLHGKNVASAMIIIATMPKMHIIYVYLKVLRILGTSKKKLENSTSFEVAPHDMLISNIWQRSAWDMWRETPPKNIMNMKHHFKFSMTEERGCQFECSRKLGCEIDEDGDESEEDEYGKTY